MGAMRTATNGPETRKPPSALPPGQSRVEGFPRFGTGMYRPPPTVPPDPVIEVVGAIRDPIEVPVAQLATLPRREIVADFHCVAGWSAVGLRWEGVAFETFYRTIIEPALPTGTPLTHLVFRGLDGWRSLVQMEDALDPEVLIADRLDGRPLDPDHGAPVRLLSPAQYGFMSTKHLCRIEAHTQRPAWRDPTAIRIGPLMLPNPLVKTHPRSRVWHEERHPSLPPWAARRLYRSLVGPILLALRAGVGRPVPPAAPRSAPRRNG